MPLTAHSSTGYTLTFSPLIGAPAYEYDGGLIIRNDTDYRMITSFTPGTGVVGLLRPFEQIEDGSILRVAKGCNRTPDRCKQLNNFDHFFGFTTVPTRNPFEGLKRGGLFVGS
jgi:hypothetical protein